MRTMGMGIPTVDMTTQITPMQVTSMKTATHTMAILIMIIHITIILSTNMLITTIPITTIAVATIPLQATNIHLSALTATTIYMIIFTRQQTQVPYSIPPLHRLPPNP